MYQMETNNGPEDLDSKPLFQLTDKNLQGFGAQGRVKDSLFSDSGMGLEAKVLLPSSSGPLGDCA